MLRNFFKLNDEQAARQLQADDLKLHFQNAGSLENADLLGQTIGSGKAKLLREIRDPHTYLWRFIRHRPEVAARIARFGQAGRPNAKLLSAA